MSQGNERIQGLGEHVAQRSIFPAQVGGKNTDSLFFVDNPRNTYAYWRLGRVLAQGTGQLRGCGNDVFGTGARSGDGLGSGNDVSSGVGEHPLNGGAANIDSDGQLLVRSAHLRITERVRWRGVSGLRPRASARATARRWATTR